MNSIQVRSSHESHFFLGGILLLWQLSTPVLWVSNVIYGKSGRQICTHSDCWGWDVLSCWQYITRQGRNWATLWRQLEINNYQALSYSICPNFQNERVCYTFTITLRHLSSYCRQEECLLKARPLSVSFCIPLVCWRSIGLYPYC